MKGSKSSRCCSKWSTIFYVIDRQSKPTARHLFPYIADFFVLVLVSKDLVP
jgi:hypothetical protein